MADPPISAGTSPSIEVAGSSWLLANMREFGVELPSAPPFAKRVYGVQSASFGGPEWWRDGLPSACGYLDRVPEEVRAAIRAGECNLLFDVSNEGQPFFPEWFAVLHRDLATAGIPAGRTIFLQQNRALARDYVVWARARYEAPLTILVYDHFARRMTGLLSQHPSPPRLTLTPRSRRFTCLNYTPRANRTSFVSWLFGKGFETAGYLSFAGFQIAKWENESLATFDWYPDLDVVQAGLPKLLSVIPLQLDLDVADNRIPEYDVGPEHAYRDSYFSIITESEQSQGELQRITEKIIKPLAMLQPIILLGNPHSLRILRDYGFRTFDGFIDESYDLIDDPVKRTQSVLREIGRLITISPEEIHSAFIALRETLLYNAVHARQLLNMQFKQVIEPLLLEEIACV